MEYPKLLSTPSVLFFDPNIFLVTLCSKTRNLYSYLKVGDHVSYPYKTNYKSVIFIYIHTYKKDYL